MSFPLYYRVFIRLVLCSVLLVIPVVGHTQNIQRYNATSENNYGVVYTLPKTEYEVSVLVLEKRFTPGPLAPWATKYLGYDVLVEEQRSSEIIQAEIRAIGVPNLDKRYLVAFDKKTIAPFVSLSDAGILYSINGSKAIERHNSSIIAPSYPNPDRTMPALSREYSLAITDSKRAEIAATYLYEVRENALNIVAGEVEQMPKDGESMRLILDKLKAEESRTLRLFEGDTTQIAYVKTWRVVPSDQDQKLVLFNFSPDFGIVADGDVSGSPVVLDIRVIDRTPALDPKELARREKSEGIVYNLPGLAEVSLLSDGQIIKSERLPLTQVGTIQTLSKKMLNIKESGTTSIYFDIRSGALDRITTE